MLSDGRGPGRVRETAGHNTVRFILNNALYRGEVIWNRRKTTVKKGKKKSLSRSPKTRKLLGRPWLARRLE
jgi:Recombinase